MLASSCRQWGTRAEPSLDWWALPPQETSIWWLWWYRSFLAPNRSATPSKIYSSLYEKASLFLSIFLSIQILVPRNDNFLMLIVCKDNKIGTVIIQGMLWMIPIKLYYFCLISFNILLVLKKFCHDVLLMQWYKSKNKSSSNKLIKSLNKRITLQLPDFYMLLRSSTGTCHSRPASVQQGAHPGPFQKLPPLGLGCQSGRILQEKKRIFGP